MLPARKLKKSERFLILPKNVRNRRPNRLRILKRRFLRQSFLLYLSAVVSIPAVWRNKVSLPLSVCLCPCVGVGGRLRRLFPPPKKQRNRQNARKPPKKSLGRGKSWGQEASQQKQRPRPLRGEKTPTWGEGFPPPWALMCIHISKGACQKSYGSGKLKKNTWEGLFFSDDPKSSNFGSAGLTWRPLWPSIPQVPWR